MDNNQKNIQTNKEIKKIFKRVRKSKLLKLKKRSWGGMNAFSNLINLGRVLCEKYFRECKLITYTSVIGKISKKYSRL